MISGDLIYRNWLETETGFLVGCRHDVIRRIDGALVFARRKIILEQNVPMAKNLTVFIRRNLSKAWDVGQPTNWD